MRATEFRCERVREAGVVLINEARRAGGSILVDRRCEDAARPGRLSTNARGPDVADIEALFRAAL